jgi:galactose mutarotase-like enzyme
MPYTFTRLVRVTSAGDLELHYRVRNDGTDLLPYIWSAHPLFPLTTSTRIDLPVGARVRVWARYGDALKGMAGEFRWPHVRLEKRIVDMSIPDEVGRRYACKLFVDLPPGTTRVGFSEGAARLNVALDERHVPNVGLWINKRGWTPFTRGTPYLNFGLEPCIGAPDTLSEAVGAWHAAQWLPAGSSRDWRLTWQATNA